MKPWEFGALTPREFNLLREGYYRRRRAELENQARLVTVLVNHYPMRGKNAHTLKVEQIIGYSEEQLEELTKKRTETRRSILKKKT